MDRNVKSLEMKANIPRIIKPPQSFHTLCSKQGIGSEHTLGWEPRLVPAL